MNKYNKYLQERIRKRIQTAYDEAMNTVGYVIQAKNDWFVKKTERWQNRKIIPNR